jgi:geranylgeranyl pyrophosphate synthase
MISKFEDFLVKVFQQIAPSKTKEAMWYALANGGKRFRPQLLFSVACNFDAKENDIFYAAASIEMIHAYSLIHDDLPAMDNDSLRRGLPTVHIAYGEATAILAGDALLTLGMQLCSRLSTNEMSVKMIDLLGEMAGANGMILGQQLDMDYQGTSMDSLLQLHQLKTGRLFAGALASAAIISQQYQLINPLIEIGNQLGLCYQVQDDLLEVETDPQTRGKNASDDQNNKLTIRSYLSTSEAKIYVCELFRTLYTMIDNLHLANDELKELVKIIEERKK